jgi:hypothetical protein
MNERFRFLLVGLYAWLAAVFLGGILLDVAYANNLRGVLGLSESATVFSEISDTLLCIGLIIIITAIGAIAVTWKSGIARNLFIFSLLLYFLEFLFPIVSSFTNNLQGLSWIRPLSSGIASILAFLGLYKYYRQ